MLPAEPRNETTSFIRSQETSVSGMTLSLCDVAHHLILLGPQFAHL